MCGKKSFTKSQRFADRFAAVRCCCRKIFRARFLLLGAFRAAQRCISSGRGTAAAVRKGGARMSKYAPSPCLSCTRVRNPRACDDKTCKAWQAWFLSRWELIHRYPRQQMEQAELKSVGVNVGGRHYAAPHQVRAYLQTDPCQTCKCPKDLCATPCRVRRAWEEAKKEAFL